MFRRVLMAVTLAVTVAIVPIQSTQAAAPPTKPSPIYDAQGLTQSHVGEVAQLQRQLEEARPYLSLGREGKLVFRPPASWKADHLGLDLGSRIQAINVALSAETARRGSTPPLVRPGPVPAEAWWCTYVPNWALDWFAYLVIIEGGVLATAGLFVDATIVGIPAGVVLSALGIWWGISGGALLWYFDRYYPDGAVVCY